MKVFIWERVEICTDRYHSGGGVVVIAKDLKEAREIANSVDGCSIHDDEKPDSVYGLLDSSRAVPRAIIFPDAGCC